MIEAAIISVRVTPRASVDEITGWSEGVLRVRLKAPPIDGRANESLCRLLAARLGISQSAVTLVTGATARTKRIRIEGRSPAAVAKIFGS